MSGLRSSLGLGLRIGWSFVCGGNGGLMIKVATMPSFFMITNDFMYIFINFTADSMYIVRYNSSVKKEGDVYATKY